MIDTDFWKGRRVFLTGHTGFKGAWLSIWLSEMGAELTGYALIPPTSPSLFDIARLSDRMCSIEGDIRDVDSIGRVLDNVRPEIVIHMAAQSLVRMSYDDPLLTYETNIMGTAYLLDAIRRCPSVRSVIVVTTDKCYENREWCWGYRENESLGGYDPYSSSKAGAEIVCASFRSSFFDPMKYGRDHSTAIASVRAGNVIGGGDWAKDRLIPDIIRSISAGKKVRIRNPNAVRPWQHVLEPLSGYLLLAERLYIDGSTFAEAWNFGPNNSDAKSVIWIVEHICELWPGSKGFELDFDIQPHEASYLKLDCSKASEKLKWQPTWNLETTLDKIVEWNLAYFHNEDVYKITREQISEFLAS